RTSWVAGREQAEAAGAGVNDVAGGGVDVAQDRRPGPVRLGQVDVRGRGQHRRVEECDAGLLGDRRVRRDQVDVGHERVLVVRGEVGDRLDVDVERSAARRRVESAGDGCELELAVVGEG